MLCVGVHVHSAGRQQLGWAGFQLLCTVERRKCLKKRREDSNQEMDAMVRKSLKIDEIESAKKGASIRIYHGKKKILHTFKE